ncbi:MAG: hypothetical protein ACSW8D_00505 [Prevotella sp.]
MNWTHRNVWTDKFDDRMDLLSKLLALYPFTDIDRLVDEFKFTAGRINQLAQFYGVHKTKEKRRDINIKNGRDVFLRKYWAQKNKDKE